MGTKTERYLREERRVITALSADLVGSTALATRLDPEDAPEIIGGALPGSSAVTEDVIPPDGGEWNVAEF